MSKIILTVFVFFLAPYFSEAQNPVLQRTISVDFSDKSIPEVLNILSGKTGYFFSYDAKIVSKRKKINLNLKDASLRSILDTVFNVNQEYQIVRNHIIITKENDFYRQTGSNNKKSFIQFSGKISDAKTKNPIPYVSIGILNTTRGTVTNQNGGFSLIIPLTFKDSVIYISSIGYKSIELTASEISGKTQNIKLQPEYISIPEVIIRNEDPLKIVSNAIFKVKDNYIQQKCLITSFYREGVFNGHRLNNYSEAVIKILKTPYKFSLKSDKIRVLKSRKYVNMQQKDTLALKLQDGLYASVQLDIVRNQFDFFTLNTLTDYYFNLVDIVSFENKTLFAVEFKPKSNSSQSLYKGKLYIDIKNYALVSAEINLNLKTKKNRINFVVKKNKKVIVLPISASYLITYKKINHHYILNHVRADLKFKVRKKRSLFSDEYTTFFETAAVSYNLKNTDKFNKKEILKRNTVFIDNSFTYDPEFWLGTDFITPEKSIKDALKKISAKISSVE